MRDQSPEGRRVAHFLHPDERAYLDEQGSYPGTLNDDIESGGRRAKSRIKNEVATPSALKWIISDFYQDLQAVSNYHRTDREAWQDWEDDTLPHIEQELGWLRDLLDRMLDTAERDRFEEEHEELVEALSNLYEGDHHPAEAYRIGGVTELSEEDRPEEFDDVSPDELDQRFQALETRQQGLETILRAKERPAILEYIAEKGPVALTNKEIGDGGEPWARVASRELVGNDLARKRDGTWEEEYELTDHGRAVVECWRALQETAAVEWEQDARPDASTREAVRFALDLHELPITTAP